MASTHSIPSGIDITEWQAILREAIAKQPDVRYGNGLDQPPTAIVYEDDLTAGEITTYDALAAQVAVETGAQTQAGAIPNWATWDESTALTWHDTNIGGLLPVANLAEANTVLANLETENRALVRLIIALRNQAWPGLQE